MPSANSFVNSKDFSYSLSEDLQSGEIIFQSLTSGVDSHSTIISGTNLSNGPHNSVIASSLDENAKFNVVFSGVDLAGNSGTTIVSGLTYDTIAPEFTNMVPSANSFVNSKEFSYSVNEDLQSGEIIFQSLTPGVNDHSTIISGADLNSGSHSMVASSLDANAKFNVVFSGVDLAGNTGTTIISGITYDTPNPIFVITPKTNSFVNSTDLVYSVNEILSGGSVIVSENGGDVQPFVLSTNVAEHTETMSMNDGLTYTITLSGVDLAGNDTIVSETNITYDITPPEITNILPSANSFVNSKEFSYNASEDLQSGEIIFQSLTSGVNDHSTIISGADLNSGSHSMVASSLDANAKFNVVFSGVSR